MSPKPGSPPPPAPSPESPPLPESPLGPPSAPPAPAGSEPGMPAPEGLGLPPLPDELEPALPPLEPLLLGELELLDPELPLLELGELGPLAPPEGEDDPELEEGGDGQPINRDKTLTNAPAASGRSKLDAPTRLLSRDFITVAVTAPEYPLDPSQKTTQSYQSLLPRHPRSEA